jgi:hypothetical protein
LWSQAEPPVEVLVASDVEESVELVVGLPPEPPLPPLPPEPPLSLHATKAPTETRTAANAQDFMLNTSTESTLRARAR